ncbi:hypothetical protein N7470_007632 [Penicillium chermesinum]|nr:hypothetical protein N7470_007632 [Penicillium chermesinum]
MRIPAFDFLSYPRLDRSYAQNSHYCENGPIHIQQLRLPKHLTRSQVSNPLHAGTSCRNQNHQRICYMAVVALEDNHHLHLHLLPSIPPTSRSSAFMVTPIGKTAYARNADEQSHSDHDEPEYNGTESPQRIL